MLDIFYNQFEFNNKFQNPKNERRPLGQGQLMNSGHE